MKNVLVVGGGGREHAIIMKLAESKHVGKLYCAPGNGGISKYAECFNVAATDIDGIVALAKQLKPEVEEDLIAEVQRLRAENAYLKKLRALILEEERRGKGRK